MKNRERRVQSGPVSTDAASLKDVSNKKFSSSLLSSLLIPVWLAVSLTCSVSAMAEDMEYPDIGGSSSPGNQLKEDALVRETQSRFPDIDEFFKPTRNFLDGLDKYGLRLGVSYQALWLKADKSLTGDDEGVSGYLSISGKWQLTGRGSPTVGTFGFDIQNRHRIWADQTPTSLGGQIGYLGSTGITFSDTDGVFDKLFWQQTFQGGRNGFVIGRIDYVDHVDFIGNLVPRMAFFNSNSLLNASIKRPLNGFGAAGRFFLNNQIFLLGVLGDGNGSLEDIKWFPGGAELFSYGEIGWTPSPKEYYKTKVHMGVWHMDKREDAGEPESHGIVFSGNVTMKDVFTAKDEFMPFFRAGFSDGEAPVFNATVNGGFIYTHPEYRDQMGVSATWNKPSVSGLRDQTTLESFYKIQVSDNISFTMDVQWLVNPALNPGTDNIFIYGFGVRLSI